MASGAELPTKQEQFDQRLGYWQRALQKDGPDVRANFGGLILEEMGELCDFTGVECEFSGFALFPVLDESKAVSSIKQGSIVGMRGVSNGVQILNVDGNYRIWYEFVVERLESQVNVLQTDSRTVFASLIYRPRKRSSRHSQQRSHKLRVMQTYLSIAS